MTLRDSPGPTAQSGQALVLVIGAIGAAGVLMVVLTGVSGALGTKAARQRATDLAAICAAQAMRQSYPRLFVPVRSRPGSSAPTGLTLAGYLEIASEAARSCARDNGLDDPISTRFADPDSFAPLRVTVTAAAAEQLRVGARRGRVRVRTRATAEMAPAAQAAPVASSGEYRGPFAYRQGRPMRPDVAQAFDRMAAAAEREAGISLTIASAYRSDAEQAELFARNPDPRWVARPGTSLHRLGTELDLGPSTAYGWLAANASRFGFTQRYSWEPWHYGFTRSPGSTSVGFGRSGERGGALPAFVPERYRAVLLRASQRWGVSAALLAAQLYAESNFNPTAVSPAGARGIAQFMPGTARAYGLDDPFDADASIDAQARMMRDLLARFASVPLALAAYNAGSGAVGACGCIPPYPETEAYVAKVLGLLNAAGQAAAPSFEVRLAR